MWHARLAHHYRHSTGVMVRVSERTHAQSGRRSVEIRKHPMGPVPKWGLYFYWGRGITRVGFNRPLFPAHVDASD